MPYQMEWKPNGVIKRFHGLVTYDDVLESEKKISGSAHFNTLRYVISDYKAAQYEGITDSQMADINALRIGAYLSNKNIKYAFVITNPVVERQIQEAVSSGFMPYPTRIFTLCTHAAQWVGLTCAES